MDYKMTTLKSLAEVERDHIFIVLKSLNFNREKSARALGICIRTLRIKIGEMRELGFPIPKTAKELELDSKVWDQSEYDRGYRDGLEKRKFNEE